METREMSPRPRAVVVGSGVAGLTAAYCLEKRGISVDVIEASERIGGVLASKTVEGFDLDLGPNSLVLTPALQAWAEELTLKVLDASPVSGNRYLVKDRKLHALSPHPLKLLRSPYLSLSAKGRLLTERFRSRGKEGEQSVGAFFRHRFGREITAAVADPIFSGIYAGDIDRLSIDQVLPLLPRWEQEYGSVTKGLFQNKGALKGGRRIVSFEGGMGSLVRALSRPLASAIQTGAQLTGIREEQGCFIAAVTKDGQVREFRSEYLVWAAPLHAAGNIAWFGPVRTDCEKVEYVPIRTVHLAIAQNDLELPPGFGFLVPSRENLSLMGCIFTSSIFPSKAPPGSALLTLMLGGAHQGRNLLQNTDAQQLMAIGDLCRILGLKQEPRVLNAHTWTQALPQKNLGYATVLDSLKSFENAHPGFRFAGNAISGVSVGDTMDYASRVANEMK